MYKKLIGTPFEVGKKYEYCGDGTIAECVFAGKTVWVLVDTKTSQEYTPMSPERWAEYKEPRTITRWINVYDRGDELGMGVPWETREKAAANSTDSRTYKDTIPITYTEPL